MDSGRFARDLDFRRVAPGTRWQYLRVARLYDRPDFSRDSVITFMQSYRGRSRSYTRLVLHALKSYARSLDMPWGLTQNDVPRSSTPQRPFLTYAQFQQLLDLARPNPQHYAILRVMGATCTRREEVVRMMVDDYARPVLQIRTAKGGEPGACTLDPETCDAIEAHLRSRSRASPSLFAISAASLSQVFRGYVRELGLPPRTGLHAIRRGVATWLFNAGMRERELQDVGRWKSPAMPAIYVQLVPGQVDKEVQKKHPMFKTSLAPKAEGSSQNERRTK